MKTLNGKNYVELKNKRYIFHPNEDIKLRERMEPKTLRTQYQAMIITHIRQNQIVFKTAKGELGQTLSETKNKQKGNFIDAQKINAETHSCKGQSWIQFGTKLIF